MPQSVFLPPRAVRLPPVCATAITANATPGAHLGPGERDEGENKSIDRVLRQGVVCTCVSNPTSERWLLNATGITPHACRRKQLGYRCIGQQPPSTRAIRVGRECWSGSSGAVVGLAGRTFHEPRLNRGRSQCVRDTHRQRSANPALSTASTPLTKIPPLKAFSDSPHHSPARPSPAACLPSPCFLWTASCQVSDVGWSTVGVNTNIISASMSALMDGLEYALVEYGQSCSIDAGPPRVD